MSRLGKKPVDIVKGAKVKYASGVLHVEGPKGKLKLSIPSEVVVDVQEKDNKINVQQGNGAEKRVKAFHGLYRSMIQNMIVGVTQGYEKRLELNGVGFRAKVEGKKLEINAGYSHPILITIPEGITVGVENKNTLIIINGADKHMVGQIAANVRNSYPPEPYKGKGIKYAEEVIRRKKGKRVA